MRKDRFKVVLIVGILWGLGISAILYILFTIHPLWVEFNPKIVREYNRVMLGVFVLLLLGGMTSIFIWKRQRQDSSFREFFSVGFLTFTLAWFAVLCFKYFVLREPYFDALYLAFLEEPFLLRNQEKIMLTEPQIVDMLSITKNNYLTYLFVQLAQLTFAGSFFIGLVSYFIQDK